MIIKATILNAACADPESFVRGGPILKSFFFVVLVEEGREDPNTTIYKRAIISRFAGVSMTAKH